MSNRTGILLLALALLPTTLGAFAEGYVPTRSADGRIAWRSPHFDLVIGGIPPRGVTLARMLEAARAAAMSWNEVACADVRIEVLEAARPSSTVERDGANQLVAHAVAWCSDERGRDCHDGMSPGVTSVRLGTAAGTRREIQEVDVELNAVDFRWDVPSAPNGADLETVLTHEFGHALGLADACRLPGGRTVRDARGQRAADCTAATDGVRASVMWPLGAPNDVRRRHLSNDDIRAVCAMYPNRR